MVLKKYKNTLFYLGVTGVFSVLIYWIIGQGKLLELKKANLVAHPANNSLTDFVNSMLHNLQDPLAILLAQIVMIILVARIFGWFFKKIGQPTVIGEIIAGIVLGPSLVGMYFPDFSAALFPAASLGNLKFLSQIGLILFMFVIGMELDVKVLKNKASEAIVISHASIIIPFAMGIGLSYLVYNQFAPQGVEFLSFSLFMGIAMSITAFPVLARIVQERGIHKTRLGAIVITCAAADDITAWCLLAVVIAIVKAGDFVGSLYVISLAFLYVLAMLFIVKPFLKRIGDLYAEKENIGKPVMAIFFLLLIISSYATEVIGIHALFGGFMMGAIMPDIAKFRMIFIEKVEDVSVILLLPLFFVFTGLNTQVGLINDAYLWKVTAGIIAVAVVGKFLGSALAARFVGQNWHDSLTIGALMNTRGLMELIVLNIGLELKVLTPEVFTMMVIMALVTTFMTGPALDLLDLIFKGKRESEHVEILDESKYRILISFGNNEKGKALLRLANGLTKKQKKTSVITAMHLSQSDELHSFNMEEIERETFEPIFDESDHLGVKLLSVFKVTNDIETEIAEVANNGDYDLLLVGVGKSIFEGSLLGKVIGFTTRIINPDRLIDKFKGKEGLFENSPFDERTRQIVAKTKTPLGILIDNDFETLNHVFVPILKSDDAVLIDYVQKMIFNNNSKINILDMNGILKNNFVMQSAVSVLLQKFPNNINIISDKELNAAFFKQQDLILISLESWKSIADANVNWPLGNSSVLIIRE
ncbi:transporter, CPA2 family [Flavobacterium glycines]|uniref:Cation/H(+) antiporter n=1 Tax=Flavobacterium glycines TaxID=551990 RepID=A0A1B9DSF9_9FLAO|nr:transporter [Flavobacterium glycines]GEL10108.1 cation/H(+) antiporter [Flavobacterium glycines]SDI81164.1 transporter, CPA2 family [Flavobacterium glycines]